MPWVRCGGINPHNAEDLWINHGDVSFFQFEIILNVLVSFFLLVWIPMLWVYGYCKYVYPFSAGINFRRQNLTSKVDPRTERVNIRGVMRHSSPATPLEHQARPAIGTVLGQHGPTLCQWRAASQERRKSFNPDTTIRWLVTTSHYRGTPYAINNQD